MLMAMAHKALGKRETRCTKRQHHAGLSAHVDLQRADTLRSGRNCSKRILLYDNRGLSNLYMEVKESALPCPVLFWTAHTQRLSQENAAKNVEAVYHPLVDHQAVSIMGASMITMPSGGLWTNLVKFAIVWRAMFAVRKSNAISHAKTQLLHHLTAAAQFAMNGDVRCSPLPCPVLTCPRPVHRGETAARGACDQCEYEAQVYTEGQTFSSTRNPCIQCHCSAGTVSCEDMASSCPPLRCSHPARSAGECCPSCKECEYERRVYANGNVFTPDGSGPCLRCTCKNGNVICRQEKCPPVLCANPIIDPQLCCPICKVCVLEGVEFEEGSEWHPDGPCSSCTCVNGETRCTHTHCPPTDCLHPTKMSGTCCPVCDSCTYNHRIYSNGQRFTSLKQPCQICTCLHGTVTCERRDCPPVTCTNPSIPPEECCPKCPDCSFENRMFVDGEAFRNPVNVCEVCKCQNGQMDCYRKECPAAHCNAPVPGECCNNICDGCSYAGKEYPNGQEFPHPTDKCRTCACTNGNVQCLKTRCPHSTAPNLVFSLGSAAPSVQILLTAHMNSAHTTILNASTTQRTAVNHVFAPMGPSSVIIDPAPLPPALIQSHETAVEAVTDPSDPCAECMCHHGSVVCEKKRCPPSDCKHPVQRSCCKSCDGCMYKGKEYLDSIEFADDNDPCSVCYCHRGEVVCTRIPCLEECSHPYRAPGQCCVECERCYFNSAVLRNGQSIPDRENPCSQCTCQSGSVRCERKTCPPAYCPHPAPNPCGCPVCDECLYQGVTYVDGQTVTGGNGGCQVCTCRKGEVACAQRRCPAVSCPHPALDACGCGECEGCNYYGRDCYSGENFPHPTDHCQRCTCLSGAVACTQVPCAIVTCRHLVVPPGECCPVCTGDCVHEGRKHLHGSMFSPSSDPCTTCSCLNEVVSCEKRACPVQCSHPVPSDSCCPACDSCMYEGALYPQGETFSPSEPCQRCTCVWGSVTCSPLLCPKLACSKPSPSPDNAAQNAQSVYQNNRITEKDRPGDQHKPLLQLHLHGCMYEGQEHPEGSSWFADSTPCVTCMCVDGVTTCSEVRCLSPCHNFISVPGECCPVCADCIFDGRVYGPGESFHPADDPCQICTCEMMPDGEQHLRCYRKQCPSLVDCPKSNIHFSGPDSCCPICAQPLSNCTSALIGNEVLATDDPCFTCQCQDLTWTCLHQFCPSLNCPPSERVIPPDSCCPVCKDCVIEGQDKKVTNGSSWTDSDDHCITCTCNLGFIECTIEECEPVICPGGQKPVKMPEKCCHVCQAAAVPCVYQGVEYQWSERWAVDECTSCTCVFGEVHCHIERCPPITCSTDEMPALVPGVCCPHCIPRPATCIAFGDPHYRTFDGRMLHFQGACTYVLAQDCEGGDFSIHATNDERGRKGVSWTKEVNVFIGNVSVQLQQDWAVKVNDEPVSLPFLLEPYIYIERQTNIILLNTNIGLKVTRGVHALASCRPGEDVDPCKDAGFQAKKSANTRCKVLKSSVFKACHRVVPPEPWYAACVYDMCACGANADECLCDTLEAYASQCREAGVVLQWRSPSLCAVGCPVERGFVFDECGPLCPVTCFNKDVPLGVIENHCFKPCVPGCQCPAGLVLHNNYCIHPDKCPKIIHEKDN
ncbi:hypothetical protein WMY93_024122 [Mugilogobius chulae]|uniref:Kielin/chordin-like protein n=1 Tax=Mugilogobius chulae TaxID=88201 RepID=A0AAW0ND66_9GOBI